MNDFRDTQAFLAHAASRAGMPSNISKWKQTTTRFGTSTSPKIESHNKAAAREEFQKKKNEASIRLRELKDKLPGVAADYMYKKKEFEAAKLIYDKVKADIELKTREVQRYTKYLVNIREDNSFEKSRGDEKLIARR